jgi:hypothetical protein
LRHDRRCAAWQDPFLQVIREKASHCDNVPGGRAFAYRHVLTGAAVIIRKLNSGKYSLYSRKINAKTGERRNLGTFDTREEAKQHEREVQFFKRKG